MRRTNTKNKLRLERETVAVLQSVELNDINGGIMYTGCISGCTKCPGDVQPQPQAPQNPRLDFPTQDNRTLPDVFKTFTVR
jgi:hypothetical protein